MDKAIIKNVCKSVVGWLLVLVAANIADAIAGNYGYKNSKFAEMVPMMIFIEFFQLQYRHAKLQKETSGSFAPTYLSGKSWVIFKHGVIIFVLLVMLYFVLAGVNLNHSFWGGIKYPLWTPPAAVVAGYAAWFYWRRIRMQKATIPKSQGQV